QRQQSSSMNFLERSVNWVLEHRFMTIFIVMLLLITGGVGVAKTGVDFLPETDEGFFTIDMELEKVVKEDKTKKNITEKAKTQEENKEKYKKMKINTKNKNV